MSAPDEGLERDRRQETARWLAIAAQDPRFAQFCLGADKPAIEIAAYHCQQAAEQLIKGLLVLAGVHFPKTHDMETLGDLAASRYPHYRAFFAAASPLTDWGYAYRYPSLEEEREPSRSELQQALENIANLTGILRSLVVSGDSA